MTDDIIKLKKQKIQQDIKELENLEKIKQNKKNIKFTKEVDDNLKEFENIKLKIGDLKSNEDISEIANCLLKINNIKNVCTSHDYDYSDPYIGALLRGPEEAHIINSDLIKEVNTYLNDINNHIMNLLIKYKWKKC